MKDNIKRWFDSKSKYKILLKELKEKLQTIYYLNDDKKIMLSDTFEGHMVLILIKELEQKYNLDKE